MSSMMYFQPVFAYGLGSLQFQNGSTPIVSRTCLFAGVNMVECKTPPMPICCYNGHLYLEHAEMIREKNRTKGLKLFLYTEGGWPLECLGNIERRKQRAALKAKGPAPYPFLHYMLS